MRAPEANHYTETVLYSLESTIRNIKSDINQYVSSILEDITPEQFFVLDTIYSHNDCCQKDICELLIKDKSNVKRIVEILESKKLIRRIVGRKNNRLVNYLEITENGKVLVETHIKQIKAHMVEMFKDISNDEIQTLKNIISKLSK